MIGKPIQQGSDWGKLTFEFQDLNITTYDIIM